MAAALDKLKPFIGKPCTCTWQTEPGIRIRVIDWAQLDGKQRLLDELFGDCDVPGDYAEVLGETSGGIVWMSGKLVPVAFVGQQDGSDDPGPLEAIVVLDISKPTGTVYSIPVAGAAIPQKKLTRVAASIDVLKIVAGAVSAAKPAKPAKPAKAAKASGPAFDELRPKLVSQQVDGDAKKLLGKLSGDKDGGATYLHDHVKKKPVPPANRDPRWIGALRDELASSIVWASASYQSETYLFAGTLASFGAAAIPALVGALDAAITSYPQRSLDHGVKPVLAALDVLKSDAGIPGALAVIERATTPETSLAVGDALAYLAKRSDKRIAPVLAKLSARPGIEQAPYWGVLEPFAKR